MFWIRSPSGWGNDWFWCPKCDKVYTMDNVLEGKIQTNGDSCCNQTLIRLPSKVKVIGLEGHTERKESPKKKEQSNKSPPLAARIIKIEEEIQQICQTMADLQLKLNSLLLAQQQSGST